jgi:hypothetical protein
MRPKTVVERSLVFLAKLQFYHLGEGFARKIVRLTEPGGAFAFRSRIEAVSPSRDADRKSPHRCGLFLLAMAVMVTPSAASGLSSHGSCGAGARDEQL